MLTNCTYNSLSSQCAIPVFDGLLPEPHNGRLLRLLFIAIHWHGLAKLRSHNDVTLDILDSVTISLGEKLREFNHKTCSAFNTRELPREYNARLRREAKRSTTTQRTHKDPDHRNMIGPGEVLTIEGHDQEPPTVVPITIADTHLPCETVNPGGSEQPRPFIATGGAMPHAQPNSNTRRPKTLNLHTYKIHSLGDYSATIRRYGTTDSYTTETVSNIYSVVL